MQKFQNPYDDNFHKKKSEVEGTLKRYFKNDVYNPF